MQVIAGLGNPGDQYERNRHNVGFMAVDAIHRHHSFSPWRRKFQALIADGQIDGTRVLLMKPQTYMNESGRAIVEATKFYKIAAEDVLVVYDELDLPPGKFRVKRGGGHGGHNGPRSVHAHIGPDYRRLRIGIGHPGDRNRVHNWVLSDFAKADQDWLETLLEAVAANAGDLASGEDSRFSNKVHLALSGKTSDAGAQSKAKPERQAAKASGSRQATPDIAPATGPLAEALNRLFGKSSGSS